MTALAHELGVSLSAVSVAAQKGERLAHEQGLELIKLLNAEI